jgi:hypothetical protein
MKAASMGGFFVSSRPRLCEKAKMTAHNPI